MGKIFLIILRRGSFKNLSFRVPVSFFFSVAFFLIFSNPSFAAFDEAADNSCIQCHSSLKEEKYRKLVSMWADSIHAKAGNTCDGCHGGDPTVSDKEMSKKNNYYGVPEEEKVVDFCGKCHREIAKRFMTSTHGEAEIINCVNCHSSHLIRNKSTEIINKKNCGECHEDEIPQKLKNIFLSLYSNLGISKEKVKLISGFPTGTIVSDLKRTEKKLRQIRRINHSFDLEIIQKEVTEFDESLAETNSEIDRLTGLTKKRKLLGYILVSTFLLLAVVTIFFNRHLE